VFFRVAAGFAQMCEHFTTANVLKYLL
jgi:hypothetical protein